MMVPDYQRWTKLFWIDVVLKVMDDDLVMDVSGSWVRRAKTSAAAQLKRFSDAAEKLFVAQHRENVKLIWIKNVELEYTQIEKLVTRIAR